MKTDDLINRLKMRANIPTNINTPKSVQEGAPDLISDLLEEAAEELKRLKTLLNEKYGKVEVRSNFLMDILEPTLKWKEVPKTEWPELLNAKNILVPIDYVHKTNCSDYTYLINGSTYNFLYGNSSDNPSIIQITKLRETK